MSGSNLLAFVIVIALAITIWATVLFIVPSVLRSLFRYRMWHFRDSLVDTVLDRRVSQTEAQPLIELSEFTISNARELTMLRLLAFRMVFRRHSDAFPESAINDDSDSAVIAGFRERFGELLAFHLITGSPSGWVAGVVLLVREAFRTRWKSTTGDDSFRREVENEFVGEVAAASRATALVPPRHRRSRPLVHA